MTGGPTGGTIPTSTTRKSLWWIVLTFAAFITLIWVVSTLKSEEFRLMWGRMWKSPHDFVQGPGGGYYPRGESPQSIAERAMKNSLPLVGRIYAPGSTLKLDNEWQGVACFDPTKRIIGEITSDVWIEFRADQRDETIVKLPPSNWTEPTSVKVPPGNISEWRIMQDQTGTATAVTRLANKP